MNEMQMIRENVSFLLNLFTVFGNILKKITKLMVEVIVNILNWIYFLRGIVDNNEILLE